MKFGTELKYSVKECLCKIQSILDQEFTLSHTNFFPIFQPPSQGRIETLYVVFIYI